MEINERNIRIDSALRAALKIGALSIEEYDSACRLITAGEKATTPQPTTPRSTAEEIDAVFRRNLDLLIQNLTVDSDNKITWMAISCRGVEQSLYPLASKQPDRYQQLLGVAYVVLGCLVANGVDIPERFLDAFSDPDSVEKPLELLPCDFSPAQAVRAAAGAALTDEQREAIKYARSVMGSVSWETPDSIRAKAVLDALLAPAVATPPSVTIETAVGNDLDAIGNEWYMRRLVGEPCDGYRARIKDRIEEFKEWRASKGASQ